MTAITHSAENAEFYVIHPLDDAPEQKHSGEHLGRIHLSAGVRLSLFVLRAYLILVTGLTVYHLLDLFGLFGHRLH